MMRRSVQTERRKERLILQKETQNEQARQKKSTLDHKHASDMLHFVMPYFVCEDSDRLIDAHLVDERIE